MRWIEYTKLSNGQSAVICFDKNYRHEIGSGYDYAVAFAIEGSGLIVTVTAI